MRKINSIPINPNFSNTDESRLVNNSIAYTIKDARLSTTRGSDLEHIKYVGQLSIFLRLLTSKDGYLISFFDKIKETEAGICDPSLNQKLFNKHDLEANKGQIRR